MTASTVPVSRWFRYWWPLLLLVAAIAIVLPFDSFALTIPPSDNRPVHALDVARRVVNASELRV